MNWEKGTKSKVNHRDVAEQVLLIYLKCLQDPTALNSILSEYCVLDYFGKVFYGKDKVASHIISNLHGSSYELSSLSVSDQPSVIEWSSLNHSHQTEKEDDDLGVTLISPPKCPFPSLTFSTPVRTFSQIRKRSASESSADNCDTNVKMCKTDHYSEQSSSVDKNDANQQNMLLSPQSFQAILTKDMKYLTAYGTIRYPKRVLPTMNLKRVKHHSLVELRNRFCQLHIGFECDERVLSTVRCKIQTIKYGYSSKVTPRNLLKAFNEVDMC